MIATPKKQQKASSTAAKAITNNTDTQDFVLLCPSASATQAIHALYYLPQHYKVRVLADMTGQNEDITSFMATSPLIERVEIETTGLQQHTASPFSYAHIVGQGAADVPHDTDAPVIVLSSMSGDGSVSIWPNSFTIPADSPEALASAALHASRASV